MAEIAITNELAQTAGTIARHWPDRTIVIRWMDGLDEAEWLVTATDGINDVIYLCRDDTRCAYYDISNEMDFLRQINYPHPAIQAQQ